MADVKTRIGDKGETYYTVIFSEEEKEALKSAHEIVKKRFEDEGLQLTERTVWQIDSIFQGIVRFDGIDELMKYAKTARISK